MRSIGVVLVALVVGFSFQTSIRRTSSGGGKVTTSVGRGDTSISALVGRPDGKLVAAGTGVDGSGDNIKSSYLALVRYDPDGRLDSRFGVGGKVMTTVGPFGSASALVRLPNGKLVTAGYSSAGGSNEAFALVRYNPDGKLDTSFHRGGKAVTRIIRGDYSTVALLLEPGGKLVGAAGSTSAGSYPHGFVLVRFGGNGTLDASFGRGGKVTAKGTSDNDIAVGLVRLPDGKLVAAATGSASALTLRRFSASGNLDRTFGRRGEVTSVISTSSLTFGLIRTSSGKLVAAGAAGIGESTGFFVVRFDRNGTSDESFGRGGKTTTLFGGAGGNDEAQAILAQPDGKLVVAGSSTTGSGYEFALARYNANGSLDTTFGRR